MEPLIDIYVEQEMAFVAMRLLDGRTSDSISPIEITYEAEQPMIPLQLTAVAAQPNMPIWVWLFGDAPAGPTNFTRMEIATEELTFFPFGGNDYTFLVQQRANALDGHAFITEFAQPTDTVEFETPWLQAQAESTSHLTRLNTYIDPEEMTADPVFVFDSELPLVSNIRDARDLTGLYNCERNDSEIQGDALDAFDESGTVIAFTREAELPQQAASSTVPAAVEDSLANIPLSNEDSSTNRGALLLLVVGLAALVVAGSAAVVMSFRRN